MITFRLRVEKGRDRQLKRTVLAVGFNRIIAFKEGLGQNGTVYCRRRYHTNRCEYGQFQGRGHR